MCHNLPTGVLWIYSEIISGSPQTINRLKEIGKKIFYVTNNSTKTRDELYKKSQDMGYKSDKVGLDSCLCGFLERNHYFQLYFFFPWDIDEFMSALCIFLFL